MSQPLTTAMAFEHGISRRRLSSSSYRQLLHGVFIEADARVTIDTWVRAALLVLPEDAKPCGLTALQLAGLDYGQPLPLRFATAGQLRSRRKGIQLRRMRRASEDHRLIDALIEHCQQTELLDAVTVADRAMYRKLINESEIEALHDHSHSRVRLMAQLASPGAESPAETRLRLNLVLAGLPEPRLQVELYAEQGRFVGRFDMGWDEFRVLGEYEGDQHRTDKQQWNTDIRRFDAARRLGHESVRVTAEPYSNPWGQVQRVHHYLVMGGYRGPEPMPSPLWNEVFGTLRERRTA